jgi:hypothetical protein
MRLLRDTTLFADEAVDRRSFPAGGVAAGEGALAAMRPMSTLGGRFPPSTRCN